MKLEPGPLNTKHLKKKDFIPRKICGSIGFNDFLSLVSEVAGQSSLLLTLIKLRLKIFYFGFGIPSPSYTNMNTDNKSGKTNQNIY